MTIMGDLIEFTASAEHQKIFYKISSGAIVFYIKGSKNAAVGLTEKLRMNCEYWIFLGCNEQCGIQKNGKVLNNISTPNILSEEKYKRFWISWFNGELQLGKAYENTPILAQKLSTRKLQYVTFSVLGNQSIQWKICLPPDIERPILKKLNNDLHWVKADKKIPINAVIGGYESGILYIIRAHHRGSLTPGKFVSNLSLAFISWDGAVHEKSKYEVLCGYNYQWVKTFGAKIPIGALVGGYTEVEHETLYIGRISFDTHLVPGKVQLSNNFCAVPYNGNEERQRTYEILINPHNSVRDDNNFYFTDMDFPDVPDYHFYANDDDITP